MLHWIIADEIDVFINHFLLRIKKLPPPISLSASSASSSIVSLSVVVFLQCQSLLCQDLFEITARISSTNTRIKLLSTRIFTQTLEGNLVRWDPTIGCTEATRVSRKNKRRPSERIFFAKGTGAGTTRDRKEGGVRRFRSKFVCQGRAAQKSSSRKPINVKNIERYTRCSRFE